MIVWCSIIYFITTRSAPQTSFQCIYTPSAEISSHEFSPHLWVTMCATVRKRTRWKCCQGQKNGILPIGNFKRSIFLLFSCQCAPDLLLCFQQSRIKNNSQAKNTIKDRAQGFIKDDWWRRLKDWSCAVGRGAGGAGLAGVYPPHAAAVRLRRERHHQISAWHLHASLKVTVITAVARDMSPGRDPPPQE